MKRLISIVMVTLIALMFSGCVIVDAHYQYRHGYHGGVIFTNVPPPPPRYPVFVFKSAPPPPPSVVIVGPSPSRSAPSHHNDRGPGPGGRRDLRR